MARSCRGSDGRKTTNGAVLLLLLLPHLLGEGSCRVDSLYPHVIRCEHALEAELTAEHVSEDVPEGWWNKEGRQVGGMGSA